MTSLEPGTTDRTLEIEGKDSTDKCLHQEAEITTGNDGVAADNGGSSGTDDGSTPLTATLTL